LCALSACTSGSSTSAPPEPQGPPAVQPKVIDEHAGQFDEPLADRPAGSQQEFAAATYILGHLQTAGYVPLLDPVPVEDTVRSTNVVAPPPLGDPPEVVVAVSYDTGPDAQETGAALALWLELARALYARDKGHAVEFVALGAENTRLNGGNLGSRRLVEFLRNDEPTPLVVLLDGVTAGEVMFGATGEDAPELFAAADRVGVAVGSPEPPGQSAAVLERAGIRHVSVVGNSEEVGRVLLEFLAGPGAPSPS
jgi:hypothetical protein